MANQMMNMQKMLKQAQKMQAQMQEKAKQLEDKSFTGKEPAGMVEVVFSGDKRVKAVNIKPEAIDPSDPDMLTDLLVEAFNDGINQIIKEEEKTFGGMTAGLPF